MWNIFLLRLIIASTYLIAKASFAAVKPFFFIGSFSTIAGLILLTWCYQNKKIALYSKIDLWLLVQVALYQIYLPYSIDFYAAQHVSSNIWSLIHAACPFVTALFAWITFKEVLSFKKSLGLFVGILGFAFIFSCESSIDCSVSIISEVSLTLSMIIYAYSWIITKKLTNYYHPLFINGVAMTVGGACALISSLLFESWYMSPIINGYDYSVLVLFAVVTLLGSFPLYAFLLKQYSTTFLAFSSLLEPAFVAFFGLLIFNEPVSYHFICALSLLSMGLYIFYKEELTVQASTHFSEAA